MAKQLPVVYVGTEAIPALLDFLAKETHPGITLVADRNEYNVLGKEVEGALKASGINVKPLILGGEEVLADERSIVQVLLPPDAGERLYLSVGSGTLTDVVRFASHRAGCYFISMPTAPSMDGYVSSGSSLTVGRYKQTILSRPPIAVFADLKTLCEAPQPMIASGFGDMFGKFTAVADWKLAHLLWDEPYQADIAQRSRAAVESCARQSRKLREDWANDIRTLMTALIEEGLCMLEVGNSRPASGAEHQLSHFWEMKLLRENRPAVFHGAKVGIATVLVAQHYALLRGLSQAELSRRLALARLPEREEEINQIRETFGTIADPIIAAQSRYLDRSEDDFAQFKKRILEKWDKIQEIAATVPEPEEITALLQSVNGPSRPEEIGLSAEDVHQALTRAHYVRSAFTVLNLCRVLGLSVSSQ